MGLRLTGLSSFYLFTRSLGNRNLDMFRASEQMTTQKRINRPSDDPEGTKVILGYKESLGRIEQYQRNLDVADRNLQQTETTLNHVKDILQRAKDLALQGRNGTLNQDARNAIAGEIQQLQQQLLQAANTNINGEYLFAGYKTSTQPYTLSSSQPNADPVATYAGDSNTRAVQVSESSTIVIQARGDQVFQGNGTADEVDLFQTMADLEVALRAGNLDDTDNASVGAMLDDLDKGVNQVLNQTTSVGAKLNRIEATRIEYQTQRDTLREFTSSIEDADVAQVAMELSRAKTALDATLGSANIVLHMPSLMDFIGR